MCGGKRRGDLCEKEGEKKCGNGSLVSVTYSETFISSNLFTLVKIIPGNLFGLKVKIPLIVTS